MAEHTLQNQRTYAVDRSTPPPPLGVLTGLPGVVGVESPEPSVLEVTYYDTPGLTLATEGVALCRRVDGPDPGWTLSLPAGEPAGSELTAPLGVDDEPVPADLLRPVRVHVRLEPVVPALHLRTERRAHRLIGADHAVLATLADDLVTARPLVRGPHRSSWREWEVELGDDADPGLLDAVEDALAGCGATPVSRGSGLARALGDRRPAPVAVATPTRSGPAGDLLRYAVHQQLGRLKEQDQRLRGGQPDSVHQLRIAARRLRAILASHKRLLDQQEGWLAREELRWLGRELAAARDTQVMLARLDQQLDTLPPDLVRGPVRERVRQAMHERHVDGCAQALQTLDSGRYFGLLDLLDRIVMEPPWREAAGRPAADAVEDALRRERKRVRRAARQVKRSPTEPDANAALHELRKATKRLRYAAEAARPVGGKALRRYARSVKRVQDELGEHQDSVVARATLVELSELARRHGEDGFTYGVLHAREREQAASPRRLRRRARSLL